MLDGGQAEYARVPIADSTLIHGMLHPAFPVRFGSADWVQCTSAPNDVSDDNLILLCDILPTGYYCAQSVSLHSRAPTSPRR